MTRGAIRCLGMAVVAALLAIAWSAMGHPTAAAAHASGSVIYLAAFYWRCGEEGPARKPPG